VYYHNGVANNNNNLNFDYKKRGAVAVIKEGAYWINYTAAKKEQVFYLLLFLIINCSTGNTAAR
jgi:hypothetical protein